MSSMQMPFSESFSVATTCGSLGPFQSKDELQKASMKSPLGQWSVHWRWPWKPAAMALRPTPSSPKPISTSLGLPFIMSRMMMAILVTYSQSASLAARDFWILAGL